MPDGFRTEEFKVEGEKLIAKFNEHREYHWEAIG